MFFSSNHIIIFFFLRKEKKVEEAVNNLKSNGLNVTGTVCHVGKAEDRKKLIDFVYRNFQKINHYLYNWI